MINIADQVTEEPPVIKPMTDTQVIDMVESQLILKHPCHNQAVERHIKIVSDSSSRVCGEHRRDGLIKQKLKSQKLIKCKNNLKRDYRTSS